MQLLQLPQSTDSDITVINLAELVTPMKKYQGHQWTTNTTWLCNGPHQPTNPPIRIVLLVIFSKQCRTLNITITWFWVWQNCLLETKQASKFHLHLSHFADSAVSHHWFAPTLCQAPSSHLLFSMHVTHSTSDAPFYAVCVFKTFAI